MPSGIITNHNKTGVAVRRHFLHKIMDGVDIFLFNFSTQCRNKRNLFRLYFGAYSFPDKAVFRHRHNNIRPAAQKALRKRQRAK